MVFHVFYNVTPYGVNMQTSYAIIIKFNLMNIA